MARPPEMRTMAMILAGGQGSRLSILSEARAKPAVPFGGLYRIIDFTLSNAMHSEIPFVGALTQYRPYSLMDHLGRFESWGYIGRRRMAAILPPYRGQTDASWYEGTADAVYQNLGFINRFDPDTVIVLSGDHIYRMDYRLMLAFHRDAKADLTIACQPIPWEETVRFGVMKTADGGRIVDFQEKPKKNPISNLASLGIYVFNRRALEERLRADAARIESTHDFGNDIIPRMIREDRVYCYEFRDYWRDVGTLGSYWQANMEALDPSSGLDLYAWNVRTSALSAMTASHCPARITRDGSLRNSLASRGSVIEGEVVNSTLSLDVEIRRGARVADSVILAGCVIGEGAVVERAIIDKRSVIGRNARIGAGEATPNQTHPELLNEGLTVIGKEARIPAGTHMGKNCLVRSYVPESAFKAREVPSGSCVG